MDYTKPRVLLLLREISSYNASTYNEIAKEVSLTVGFYDKDKTTIDCLFSKHHFESFSIGPFSFVRGLRSYCKQFDVVCFLPNIRIPSYSLIPFFPKSFKAISWSIGFRCSYTNPYLTDRKHTFLDLVYQRILSRCDANIFYMEKAKEFWSGTSLRLDNVFIAINTTDIAEIPFEPAMKKDFLFVGTLYKKKGLDVLLHSFYQFKQNRTTDTNLIIVGGGEMEGELKQYVKDHSLDNSVLFTGPIFDEKKLAILFQKSLICISPTQAGLSVPKSMGYGVPFVTRKDAITGGEIYHITNGVNGIVYENDLELTEIMDDAFQNKDKYIKMGSLAREYYYKWATVKHKANGALSAIRYVLDRK